MMDTALEVPALPLPEPPAKTRLYKSTLIRRLNEEENEPEILSALLDAAPVKSKMLWQASEWISTDDPLFATLEAAIGGVLGAERASQILALTE